MKQRVATKIWMWAETNRICLGRLAPHIFGWMINRKPNRVK